MSSRQEAYAHSFLCLSASTAQLRQLSDDLQSNAYYVFSEAAPAHARAGLTEAQLAAYPSLYRTSPRTTDSDVRLAELTTLQGARASLTPQPHAGRA